MASDIDTRDTGLQRAQDTAAAEEPATWPELLSQTGLYVDLPSGQVAESIREYDVAWPLWSDGAAKQRLLWLPPGEVIDTSNPDRWVFPVGTKAWKHFWDGDTLVETRFIQREEDDWTWVSYQWRADGSDADAVPDGVEGAGDGSYDIPSQSACTRCHMGDGFLGVAAIQLGEDSPTQTLSVLAGEQLLVIQSMGPPSFQEKETSRRRLVIFTEIVVVAIRTTIASR